MIEFFNDWLRRLAEALVTLGVPADQGPLAALGFCYLLAVLLVVLLVLLFWRIRRRPSRPEVEGPEVEQAPPEGRDEEEPPGEEPEAEEVPEEDRVRGTAVAEPVPEPEPQPEALPAPEPVPEPEEEKKIPSLWERMRSGLGKTRSALSGRLDQLLSGKSAVDEELLEELEELLVTADFGIRTTQELIGALDKRFSGAKAADPAAIKAALREEIAARLQLDAPPLEPDSASPFVIMVVGVNGVGKTTTIGKLAQRFAEEGRRVILGAGDTFRAAAADQLEIWSERAGVEIIRHGEGADPAAVAFDAAKAAVARKADLLILDTAGRLHTKVNLMEELKKIRRVLAREIPGAPHETLLVLDATTGQNALTQATLFREAVEVTGAVLTKLDGTARGGVVVPIAAELGLPVRFVGVGEKAEDLRPFDPELFARALFGEDGDA